MNAKAYIPPAPVLVSAANAVAPTAMANTPTERPALDVSVLPRIGDAKHRPDYYGKDPAGTSEAE